MTRNSIDRYIWTTVQREAMGPVRRSTECILCIGLLYVITVPERYRQTDRRTDDMQSHNRALRSIAR